MGAAWAAIDAVENPESRQLSADAAELATEILMASGAVRKCPACRLFMTSTGDDEAEKIAHRLAVLAWKAKEPGFREMTRAGVAMTLKRALVAAPDVCPRCERRTHTDLSIVGGLE